jgi:hypothetical protein
MPFPTTPTHDEIIRMMTHAILNWDSLLYPLLAFPVLNGGEVMAQWAEDEFGSAALGDKRLNLRLIKLAPRFAEQPKHTGGLRWRGGN